MIVNSLIENAKALFKELEGEFYPFGYISSYNELATPSPQTPGSNVLSFGFEGTEGTDWLDYSQPVANTATGSFVYYIVPKTSRGSLVFSIGNGGGGNFECELDNIKVEQVNSTFQPLYTAVLNTMSDQYAFEAPMPGRNYNALNYRYGFNGKENDRETVGTGSGTQDYGMRIYNPSLGKFLSVDPLCSKYAYYTPYSFAGNKPISAIDLDGGEEQLMYAYQKNGETKYHIVKWKEVYPDQEYGPKGSGTLYFEQDSKTKKFDNGTYQKSFEDAHPFQAFGKKLEERYPDKQGLKRLGNDISPVLQYLGKGLKIAGTTLSAIPIPQVQAISKGALAIGEGVELAGDALEIVDAIDDGDTKKVTAKTASLILGKAGSTLIHKTAGNTVDANIADVFLNETLDGGSDLMSEMPTPTPTPTLTTQDN